MDVLEIGYPFISVPPNTGYGPTEAVISCVTEELVKAGHRVALWAPNGSSTAAEFFSCGEPTSLQVTPQQWRTLRDAGSREAYALAYARGVEIIHDHTEFTDYEVPKGHARIPVVRTIHKPASLPGVVAQYQAMSRAGEALVAISGRQRDLYLEAAERSGERGGRGAARQGAGVAGSGGGRGGGGGGGRAAGGGGPSSPLSREGPSGGGGGGGGGVVRGGEQNYPWGGGVAPPPLEACPPPRH